MEMFALDDEVRQWETALASRHGLERLPLLLELAWHLRQRDTARAIKKADEALRLLPSSALTPAEQTSAGARMGLVAAEARWLNGELPQALQETRAILHTFTEIGDLQGCADSHWLLAWIAVDSGEHGGADAAFAACAECARAAGDALRTTLARAANARWDVLRDHASAVALWGAAFADKGGNWHPSVATWVSDFHALAASQSGDFGGAAAHYIRCHESALMTGQIRAAIIAATNIGEDFTLMGDHRSALEWMQSALELARPTGWPRSIGACLMHTADTLRRLGQRDAARGMLDEALEILKPLENARSYAIALQYLGDLALDQRDYAGALDAFERLDARAEALGHADFRSIARRGQAHALSQLDRPADALRVARDAVDLAIAHAQPYNQIAALRVVAMIHARHALPAPMPISEANPALHYLRQALSVAETIDGYTVPGDLYDALAREYAASGDYACAYETALAAANARDKTHSQEATNRAVAMQVHHQTEHARSEGMHHRELAESEARRAAVLQRTSATLERLSKIGQEITAHLDAAEVFATLNRHIHGLLPASTFAIYMTDAAGTALTRAFGIERGRELPGNSIPMSNVHAYSVRALAEGREIYVPDFAAEAHFEVVAGTLPNMSGLYAPLIVGEHAMGVMTVQAPQPRAYGDTERLIFRTLCAYGAIALDNAETYRRLQDAQTQLVSQEKLAALGALMAGVAHELNTPIGNSLLIASTMQEKASAIASRLAGDGLRRSELAAFIEDAQSASTLVMRGLTSAATLVNSFKQVAVDRTTEQRRSFNLHQVCHEVVATMMNRIRASGHRIDLHVPEAILLDSYPGPFGQVLTNFINNALLHAFPAGGQGAMTLSASTPQEGRVLVEFRDDGAGIAEAHLTRIFDPFFTTKLGQGGSGLGLSISYNIVTALLGGQIAVVSGQGAGTTFSLDLPLIAPAARDADGDDSG